MLRRNVNVDLFRIIATILVILLHILEQGGVLQNASPSGPIYWTACFLKICAYCAVNCFALISGYVMVNKNIKLKNIINMWFQVLFFSLLITVLFFVFLSESRNLENLMVSVMPIIGKQWWYVSSYFALFFFMPFLNKAVDNVSQQTYRKFLIITLLGICCLSGIIPTNAFALNGGYSVAWLMIVYLFGAYIKKYNLNQRVTALKSILGFLLLVILTFTSKIGLRFLTKLIFGEAKLEDILISYTSITILLASVFLFLFCLNLKINYTVSTIISFFSPATLGVYLIHVHPLVFKYIVKDAFVFIAYKPVIIMLIYTLVATLLIFVFCSIIELLRIQFFKLLKISNLCELIENKIDGFYLKVFKN